MKSEFTKLLEAENGKASTSKSNNHVNYNSSALSSSVETTAQAMSMNSTISSSINSSISHSSSSSSKTTSFSIIADNNKNNNSRPLERFGSDGIKKRPSLERIRRPSMDMSRKDYMTTLQNRIERWFIKNC